MPDKKIYKWIEIREKIAQKWGQQKWGQSPFFPISEKLGISLFSEQKAGLINQAPTIKMCV